MEQVVTLVEIEPGIFASRATARRRTLAYWLRELRDDTAIIAFILLLDWTLNGGAMLHAFKIVLFGL